jgi:hypothetical protein
VHVVLAGHVTTTRSPPNLHAVWDSTLLARAGSNEATYAASLIQDVRTRPALSEPVDFTKWAEDSHRLGVKFAYAYAGFSPGGPGPNVIELSQEYQRTAFSVAGRQLELAGERLAMILNQAFQDRALTPSHAPQSLPAPTRTGS